MIENAFGRYYLPELDVLHLFKSLCEAVLAFHECDPPLAHRDIKVNYGSSNHKSCYDFDIVVASSEI
jgi:serine/threonine protein kinase